VIAWGILYSRREGSGPLGRSACLLPPRCIEGIPRVIPRDVKHSNYPQTWVKRAIVAFYHNIHDLPNVLSKQKCGKAIGIDGIPMEALVFAGRTLHVHLCLLFNKFGFFPQSFMRAVIVPLVKDKRASLTDMSNYRAITISSALANCSKVQ